MRILAIDPGSKYIGLAISDPSGTVANPLERIIHRSYKEDAGIISKLATMENVGQIIIGQSFDEDGKPTFSGRISIRIAEAIKKIIDYPIIFWDESFSTQEARFARLSMQTTKKKRSGHLDSLAAVVLLQSYLDRGK